MNEDNINEITALVLLDDEGFDWNDGINKAVNLLRQLSIPAIIANPDGAYPMSKRNVSIAIGGLAYMIGEDHQEVYPVWFKSPIHRSSFCLGIHQPAPPGYQQKRYPDGR